MSQKRAAEETTTVELERTRAAANLALALMERLEERASLAKAYMVQLRASLRAPATNGKVDVPAFELGEQLGDLHRLISDSTSLLERLKQLETLLAPTAHDAMFEKLRAAFRDWCHSDATKVWSDMARVRRFAAYSFMVEAIPLFRAYVLATHAADPALCAAVQDETLDLARAVGMAEYSLYGRFDPDLAEAGTDEGDEAIYADA